MQTFSNIISRSAWADRFTVPTIEGVVAALPVGRRDVVEYARALLRKRRLHEEFLWQGIWRWSFVYTITGANGASAFIIPDPESARMCIPLTSASVVRAVTRPLSAYLRDRIAAAQTIDGVRWPSWRIESVDNVDELATLL